MGVLAERASGESEDALADVPPFNAVDSDSGNLAVSDPETLTDAELNMYASKLVESDA